MKYEKITNTIIFVIIMTVILLQLDNKSNFSNIFIIPIIVAGLTKYCIGDWDNGYVWSIYDLIYWLSIIFYSLITIYYIDNV